MRTKFLALAIFIFLALCPSFAQEKYTIHKFSNGQTLIIKPVRQNPIVTIDTWINTGSINETDKNSGVAHFLEHLFFKGTAKYPSGQFDSILESKGGITNAATSKDFTHYYITIPSKDFDLALSMHADMLLNPQIPRKELEKERKVVIEEISRGKDNPQSIMYNNLFKAIYEPSKHPYTRPVIGNENVINSIERDEILNFYKTHYTPSNMYTVIVGDVEANDVIKKVENEFQIAQNKETKKAKIKYPKILPISKPIEIIETKDIQNEYMTIAFKTKKFSSNKELYALDVLSAILGGSKSSKLNQILKEEKQIVNSVSTSSSNYKDDGLFVVQANFEVKNEKRVKEEIFEQIENIKLGKFQDSDISKAKNIIETQTYYSRESITDISNELGYLALYSGDISYYENYVNNIKKVTKKDIIKVAKKYLNKNHAAISIVAPNIKPVSDIKKEEVKKYSAKLIEKNEKTSKYLLESGAQLIVEKNPNNSIVAIDINNKTGNHIEKISGTLSLAAALAKEGTKNYTSKEFAQILDEKGIALNLSGGDDNFSITLQATKNELDCALNILNEVINYPSFLDSELEKIKKLKLAAIKNLEDNPLSYALDDFKSKSFQNSIYGENSVVLKKTIPTITREDIKRDFKASMNAQNIVISVVGDVNEEDLINKFSPIFTTTQDKKIEMKSYLKPTFTPTKNIITTLTKKDIKTAWLLLGYKTTNVFNEKEIATLKIINTILGEGMSSRLFKNLRDEQGLAYQIGSVNLAYALDGVFLAYIGTNEANLEKAKQGILKEFAILKTEFVTKEELTKAKDKVLGNLLIGLETNMDNAQLQSNNAALGRDINYLEQYKKTIESISQNDILMVANKYFSKPYIMTVVKNKN